jgi:hypothetical protein
MAVDTNYNYRLATDDEDFAEPWWEEEEDDQDLIDDTDDGYAEELGQ